MGRRKIQIQPIKDERNRKVTFVKRKAGLFKKAHELAVLCQVDLAVVILGHNNNKFYEYSSVGIQDLLQNFENKSFTHDVKEPKDYGDYELISRVKGTVSGANGRHQRSISAVSASIDGDHDEDDDDEDEDDEDDDEDDDSTPPTKRRKTIKKEATSSSRPSTATSRRSNSRSSQPSQSNLSSVVPVSVPNKQLLQHQLPMQQTFPVSQNIAFDFQQQFRPQIIQHQQQQQQYAQQAQGFAEVVPVSHSQPRPQFTSPPSNNNVPVHYNPDTIPFLNQLSPISSFVMNGSMGMSPFARMASTQPLSSNDRARRLNNNISKRPPLRVEIPDSTNFTLPPRSNDFTRVNIQPPTDQSQTADNKDSAATVTAPDTSKLTGNIVPKPIDQTGPASAGGGLGEGTSTEENKSFDLPGISSPIKLTPISATLPSALTGQFNLPLPQPNKPSYQPSTQFTPNQSFNNSGIGLSGGLKVSTSFNRSLQAGENTPVNVFATRIVPDVYDSPSNFFASDSWANAQFGTGNTPFPYSALPTGSNNNTSHQLPISQHNQQQNASSDLKSSSTALSSGLRITTNSNGGASLVKPGDDEVGNVTEGNSGESK